MEVTQGPQLLYRLVNALAYGVGRQLKATHRFSIQTCQRVNFKRVVAEEPYGLDSRQGIMAANDFAGGFDVEPLKVEAEDLPLDSAMNVTCEMGSVRNPLGRVDGLILPTEPNPAIHRLSKKLVGSRGT